MRSSGKVLLVGAYGHGNLGDDLLAKSIEGFLREEGFGVRVAAGEHMTGNALLPQSRHVLWRELGDADALLLGGGGLFNDEWSTEYIRYFLSLAMAARVRGVPVGAVGLGVEPITTRTGKLLMKAVGTLVTPFGVRDPESLRRIASLGANSARLGCDLGWLSVGMVDATPALSQPDIAVTIAGETQEGGARRVDLLAQVLRQVLEREPSATVRLVAMLHREEPVIRDEFWLGHLSQHLDGLSSRIETCIPKTVGGAISALKGARVALGYRLHGNLVAYLGGANVCAVSRSAKVRSTFQGMPGCAVFDEATAEPGAISEWMIRRLSAGEPQFSRDLISERRAQAEAHIRDVIGEM